MNIQIVDVSDMRQPVELKKRYDVQPSPGEKCVVTKTPMEFLPKDMVSCDEIRCQRTKKGLTDNCSLCQHVNNDIFIKCETKFSGQ
jgi:hypothetical protein